MFGDKARVVYEGDGGGGGRDGGVGSGVSDLRSRGLRHQWLEREHGQNRVGLLFQQIASVCSYSDNKDYPIT